MTRNNQTMILDATEEDKINLQRLLDGAAPEDRMSIIHSYTLEHNLTFKMRSPMADAPLLPKNILGISTSSATVVSSADKIPKNHSIRLVTSPLSGGPYSLNETEIQGDGSLSQPIIAHISGLAPNTKYYYILQIVNPEGEVVTKSPESFFTTLSYSPKCSRPVDVKTTSAVISGTSNIGHNQKMELLYWEESEGDDFEPIPTNGTLTDLNPDTYYGFIVQVVDEFGQVLDESDARFFKTLEYLVDPVISAAHIWSAEVQTTVNYVPPTSKIRVFCNKSNSKTKTTVSEVRGVNRHEQSIKSEITGLSPNTSYIVRIQIVDSSENVVYESEGLKFKTEHYNLQCEAFARATTATFKTQATYVDKHHSLVAYIESREVFRVAGGRELHQKNEFIATELKPATDQNIVLHIEDEDGLVIESEEFSFKTLPHNPEVADVKNIKDRSATLVGTAQYVARTNHARFGWGIDDLTHYSPLMFGDGSSEQSFAFVSFGLVPNSEYMFVVEILNDDGEVIDRSETLFFKTEPSVRSRRRRT